MRRLAACAAVLGLGACPGSPGFLPYDGGNATTAIASSSGGTSSSSSGSSGSSSGGINGLCGTVNGQSCTLDAGVGDGGGTGSCCSGACTNLTNGDPLNCGACGSACPTGASCTAGTCTGVDGGAVSCADAGCAAGLACEGAICLPTSCSTAAEGNACAFDAGVPGLCCGAVCTDPLTDSLNCGACNTQCSSGLFCDGTKGCQAFSACGPTDIGVSGCFIDGGAVGTCCSQGCTATGSDPANCGLCGAVCPTGTSCAFGGCVTADAGPANCFGDAGGCPAGLGCVGSYCLSFGCTDAGSGQTCLFGVDALGYLAPGECCGSSCVDITQNPADCGSCGNSCSSGVCVNANVCLPPAGIDAGTCSPACPTGQTCVGTQCVDTACGNLFDLCQDADAGDVGICCPDTSGDEACTDIANDPANCGSCALTCAPDQGCANGVCSGSAGSCGAGTVGMFCDLDAGPTYLCCPGRNCTDVRTDPLNCGGCSEVCPTETYCIDGNCLATSCNTDTQDDPCQLADGGEGGCCNSACLDVLNDPLNCGGCMSSCTGNETCAYGVCAFDVCTPSELGGPCHTDGGTGLCCTSGCADTSSDPANCGGCGISCGDAGCLEGACE